MYVHKYQCGCPSILGHIPRISSVNSVTYDAFVNKKVHLGLCVEAPISEDLCKHNNKMGLEKHLGRVSACIRHQFNVLNIIFKCIKSPPERRDRGQR